MADVNGMGIHELAPILNQIVSEATGITPITPTNEQEFISVAQTALLSGYDPLINAISQTLSKTIFSIRPYSAKFQQINVDAIRYGNHVRKLQTLDKAWEEDDRLPLDDGTSIDMYRINKPRVIQTNFYGENVYQKSLTLFRDQLDTALTGSAQFGQFLTMVMQNATDQITQAKEESARATLANMIAGVMDIGKEPQIIDVLARYNEFAGTSLTSETVFLPENFPNFTRWLYAFIQNVSDYMTERCVLYHCAIGGQEVMRHTPKADQRLYLYSPFVRDMETIVTSTTYHDEKTVFPPYEGVNYWQAITDPTAISITPSVVDDTGVAVAGDPVEVNNVIGCLFDREALGITTVNEWSATTPFNARGGYYNQYWHFTERFWNDFSENFIVFTLGTGVNPARVPYHVKVTFKE